MKARFSVFSTILLAAALAVLALPTASAQSWTVIDDDSDCHQGWDRDDERACEVREITLPATGSLISVDGGKNGGIRVEGWSRNEIRIRAKVQAWGRYRDDAEDLLGKIEVETGSTIRAEGPSTGHREGWGVSFRLMVPHASDLDLEANNGGISIEQVEGEIRFDTKNGGISLERLNGDVKGRTTNGGVSVDLDGDEWVGEGLDVVTTNGGVKLTVPEGYSAELTTGTTNGRLSVDFPVEVRGEIGKRITTTLGRGGAPVKVVTTNGGVKIRAS